MSLEDDVLARITPSADEEAAMQDRVARLEAAAAAALQKRGLAGTPRVQGSIAKGTWLTGTTDIDLFLLLDPGVPEAELKTVAEDVAHGFLTGCRQRYAQHPYVVGSFEDVEVDLVPAYAVPTAADRRSAVDRTPFHTGWVRSHLDAAARQQVRLAKQWLRGTGDYGAETATGGFSGYLVEVLVHHLGGLDGLLAWLVEGGRGPLPADAAVQAMPDAATEDAALVVVDPVDPTRNCAAALTYATLAHARKAACAYREAPRPTFFFPAPPRAEPPERLHEALEARRAAWCGIEMRARTDRLDIVLPQFQKAAARWAQGLEAAGIPVLRHNVDVEGRHILMQFVTARRHAAATRFHRGPRAGGPHADRFTAKWDGHPDAVGGVRVEDGRLIVEVREHHRGPAERLGHLVTRGPAGKHVEAALRSHRVHDDPAATPEPFPAAVADLVLDREPWER